MRRSNMKVRIFIQTTEHDSDTTYSEYSFEDKDYTLNMFKEIVPKIDKILKEKQ